jgi:tripartite-type tricarboxylate transporter receptor subunit TctC
MRFLSSCSFELGTPQIERPNLNVLNLSLQSSPFQPRRALASIAWLLLGVLLTAIIHPERVWASDNSAEPTVRILIPQPPGGSMDANMRAMALTLERELKSKIIIDNKAGANGIIAGDLLAHAPGDGLTLLYTSNSFANNQLLSKKLPFDVMRDFKAVTLAATMPGYMVLVNNSVNAKTLSELISASQSSDKTVRFGSGGIGNSQHLLGELLNAKAGAKMQHVPYKGLAPMMTALLGNDEIQVAFSAPSTVLNYIKAGKIRALAYTGSKRWAGLPNVPTVAEAAIPGFVYEAAWHGVFAPASTPKALVDRIQVGFANTLKDKRVSDFLQGGGYEPVGNTSTEFTAFLSGYLKDMAEIFKIAHIEEE